MAVFAISDLHLSFGTNKPMDIFGEHWENHALRLKENWLRTVGDDDHVLIPGDFSWGMNLMESDPDFAFIDSLPGKKILSKGNHDYWWSTLKKLTGYFEGRGYKTLGILHNNAYKADGFAVCGSRGWISPDDDQFGEEDVKIYNRELERLKLSVNEARKLGGELIAMLHYPPFDSKHKPNAFGELLRENGVKLCIYGHIHGKANESWKNEVIDGIRYRLVTCNLIGFDPVRLG